MLHGLKGERVLMRIHIGERDRHEGKPLYEAIVNLLRTRGYAGATVFRGVMGFGASGRISADRMELLAFDLPLVIECVETQEKIEAILPEIDDMIDAGLITLERAKVILYRGKRADAHPSTLPDEDRIDITGDWQQHQ
jgi:PII-like signaling protein